MLNPEIINELENIREQEHKIDRTKTLTKDSKLLMNLQSLKVYGALEMLLGMA